ncbi:hypothetical protein [Nonomuraea sp. NPDC046570]|uniref:hypothetical protein n=1 Tax=Nonomuraea sp. NPDC046570 TaxID=3155255 RepID=UPI0033EEFA66
MRPLRPGDPRAVGAYRLTGFVGEGSVYLGRGSSASPRPRRPSYPPRPSTCGTTRSWPLPQCGGAACSCRRARSPWRPWWALQILPAVWQRSVLLRAKTATNVQVSDAYQNYDLLNMGVR